MDSRTINEHYAEIGAELIENEKALESIRESGLLSSICQANIKRQGMGR